MISLSRYWRIAKLIDRCSKRPADERAWQEFVRRFHVTIQSSVVKAFDSRARVGRGNVLQLGEELKDALVQSVYRRLVADRSRLLKRFRGEDPSSFPGFLAIISVNVVSSYLGDLQATVTDDSSEISVLTLGRTRSSGSFSVCVERRTQATSVPLERRSGSHSNAL